MDKYRSSNLKVFSYRKTVPKILMPDTVPLLVGSYFSESFTELLLVLLKLGKMVAFNLKGLLMCPYYFRVN